MVLHHVHADDANAATPLLPSKSGHASRADGRRVRRVNIQSECDLLQRWHGRGLLGRKHRPLYGVRHRLHALGDVLSPVREVALVDPQALGPSFDDVLVPRRVRVQSVLRKVHDDQVIHGHDAASVMAPPQTQVFDQRAIQPRNQPPRRPHADNQRVQLVVADPPFDCRYVREVAVDVHPLIFLRTRAVIAWESVSVVASGFTFWPAERILTSSSRAFKRRSTCSRPSAPISW